MAQTKPIATLKVEIFIKDGQPFGKYRINGEIHYLNNFFMGILIDGYPEDLLLIGTLLMSVAGATLLDNNVTKLFEKTKQEIESETFSSKN